MDQEGYLGSSCMPLKLVFRELNPNVIVGQDIELCGKLCSITAIWVALPNS